MAATDAPTKNVKLSPIILDAQNEYDLFSGFELIAGDQLVSSTKNGLQNAATLMGNSYGYTQFPYSILSNSQVEGNFGCDLGVNARGFFI